LHPSDDLAETAGEKGDIEALAGGKILSGGEEIEKQSAESLLGEAIRDVAIAGALPPAPTPVSEDDDAAPPGWRRQVARQLDLLKG
jgi:hypothetical protein